MSKNSKIFCLLFLLIVLPKFVFAVSLYDDCAFMKYEDIINIQKDGNLLKYGATSYYQLMIPDAVQQFLNKKIYIDEGKKTDKGYVFVVYKNWNMSKTGTFELVHLQSKYFEFFDFSTIKVILSELLQKSEKELDELCAQHIERSGRTGKTLPLQYYLALDILSEDYKNNDATEKLKQLQIEASMHPEFVFGGSLISVNKAIRLLLEKYKTPKNDVIIEDIVIENVNKEKIKQFYENALNNGDVFPYKYYELLKDLKKESCKHKKILKEAAELSIESPGFTMGGSLEANKKIRELLWQVILKKLDMDHLLNEEDEDACNEVNKIINLLKNDYYKKWATELLIRNANEMFENWMRNPFCDNGNSSLFDFPRLALLLLPYNHKPEELPDSIEDYCLLTYHAMVTQNNEQIENVRKLAEDTFANLENTGYTDFDIENLDHSECIGILYALSPLVPEHKITLLFYSLFYAYDEYRSVYNFYMHIFNYVKKIPDVILGQNADENTAIRTIVIEVMREYVGEDCNELCSDGEVHVDSNDSDEDKSDEDDVGDVNSNISDAEKSDEEKV
ncbi:MAG: hypothetical protein Q8S31_10745 [Alphaproteobacteria bacterium]|nr:hypothetical protein [Alphaproteobacteria bacterium]